MKKEDLYSLDIMNIIELFSLPKDTLLDNLLTNYFNHDELDEIREWIIKEYDLDYTCED